MLYTLRVVAGAFAIGVRPSFWLLAFSLFLFLSLATLKRYSELRTHAGDSAEVPGRGYRGGDLQLVLQTGVSSGNVAALVLALYINSADVRASYSMPSILWLLVPLAYFTINRLWLQASRGKVSQDPVLYAIRDLPSLAASFIAVVIVVIAWLGESIQQWFI
jgi:4-hydroxybenzoate polyprenyltransferase